MPIIANTVVHDSGLITIQESTCQYTNAQWAKTVALAWLLNDETVRDHQGYHNMKHFLSWATEYAETKKRNVRERQ